MYALARRVLDLAGSFSVAARRSLIVGMVCNVLKALFMAPTIVAVFWALEHRDALGPDVIWQCLALLLVSVAGQYAMQYVIDITMDARGFDIFRDLRLRVGDRLKGAAMGYFSEQRLGAITTTLTTTLHQLEEFMTICLTGLSGGLATAAIMGIGFLLMAPPVAAITFMGIVAGLFVLRMLLRRSGAVTKRVLKAQEAMSDAVMEYARGMAALIWYASRCTGGSREELRGETRGGLCPGGCRTGTAEALCACVQPGQLRRALCRLRPVPDRCLVPAVGPHAPRGLLHDLRRADRRE